MPVSAAQNMFGSGDKTAAQHMGGPQKKSGSWLNSNAPEYNLNSDSLWTNHASENENHAAGGQPNANKPRPPPGLSGKMNQQNPGSTNSGSVWNSGLTTSSPSSGSSEYLRLRNLTAQIDGSTLKTLCLQHGPLSLFHMVLNHGVAIVRYSHRDQAFKAQSALNNCVLGNTTIIADFPTEIEIQQYLTLGGVTTTANQLSNSLAASVATWSNGTNTSHTVVTAGCGVPQQIQSYQSNSLSAASQRGVGVSAVQPSSSSSSSYGNNAASSSQTNHQNSLPYGAGATHSSHSTPNSLPFGHHHQNQFNGSSKLNAEHSIGGGWNTAPIVGNPGMNRWNDMSTGSNSTLGLGPTGASLWSSGGFGGMPSNQSGSNDRQTPIQNFLPNDLLAGENN
ncbi:RNA binding domain containing protein [Euroglyphus maynei]|uniref:RNA binding domain containing protein n=1 Tax=Euroglyphus maynei TaxID=6958 RepID=A0A1Y3BIY3_EURMA|nr:RNA binding domain containing protein [Euroglyphus maynei]